MTRPLAYEPRYALNAICPYFTMFPLEYPLRVLAKHKKEAPVVMDPFCGRGTTLYAARTLGLAARGIDSSPVAAAIAQAKLCEVSAEAVLSLAKHYIDTKEAGPIPRSEFFRWAFHSATLWQICSIRSGLLEESSKSDAVILLRAAMLGCLHGPLSKSVENNSYFSNQMPRTFASKPGYSVGFWKARAMKPGKVDVIAVLGRKLSRLAPPTPANGSRLSDVRLGDARLLSSLPTSSRDFAVVVTSPPYYGMRTYVEDQWLRNWFLGGPSEPSYGGRAQVSHAGQTAFIESLGRVWKNMSRTRADKLDMYIRFGIIPSAKADARQILVESLEASNIGWKVVSTRDAKTADSGKRQAAQMVAGSTAAAEFDFHVVRS